MVTFDAARPGTSVGEWDTMERLDALPLLDVAQFERLTVVATHPDDETLGAGGLIAECSRLGVPVRVIVVTDGAASHPNSRTVEPGELAVIRQRELFLAVSELAPRAEVVMLGFADGETDRLCTDITIALGRAIEPDSTLVGPWRGDGHRDHRVVAEVCAEVAAHHGMTLFEYPVWMWHWAQPDDARVPWDDASVVRLTHSERNAKRRAVARHASQVVGLGASDGDGPVLSPRFLETLDRGQEVFFASGALPIVSKSRDYFDAIYARSPDPWRFATRWYEERKRQVTVASLPRRRYASGLEIGCSIGELTALLAERCDSLLAIDISPAAIDAASLRLSGADNVRLEQADATVEFPVGRFDLIVLSEVAYYWDRLTLATMTEHIANHLAADGQVVACHWRHPVAEYPLRGDEAHELLRAGLGLTRVALHDEADFLLEVFSTDPSSVAAREGLVE